MTNPPKRPRDVNQWAKHMLVLATGQAQETDSEAEGKSAKAIRRGKLGGQKGGAARATKLTPAHRSEIARLAAQTRWKKSS